MAIEANDPLGLAVGTVFNQASLQALAFHHGKAPKMSSSKSLHRRIASSLRKSVRREGARPRNIRELSLAFEPLEKRVVLTDHFGFVGLANGAAGSPEAVTIEALNSFGNPDTLFSGEVDFSSSDPSIQGLPTSFDFGIGNFGSTTFTITFETAGTQTITAIDSDITPSISTSSSPVSITAGPFTKFGFIGLHDAAVGTTQTLTIAAEDAYGNVESSITTTRVDVTNSDPNWTGSQLGLLTFYSPEETFSIAFETTGTQSITAHKLQVPTFTSSSTPVTITAAAGPFAKFGFIGLQSTVAGTTQTFTVEAEDASGNEVSSFSGTVDFSSSDPNATGLSSSYTFTSPLATLSIDFQTAGTQSITATDATPTVSSNSGPVTITAGTFAAFGFIGLQSTVAGITQTFTVEAEDAYGNEVSSYNAYVNLSSSDPQATGLPSSSTLFSSPEESFSIAFKTAGMQSITANDLGNSVSASSTPVSITAGSFAKFGFIGLQSTVAGADQSLTVEAQDTYGNEVSSFSGTVDFSSSDPQLSGLSPTVSFNSPVKYFDVTFETAGAQTIKAVDGAVTSTSTPVTITAGSFAQFGFIGLQSTVAGITQTFTVEAEDTYGNEVSSFSGDVAFFSSDPNATGLPSSAYLFSSPAATLSIAFETAGTQTITADDPLLSPPVSSTSTPVTITAGTFAKFGFIGLQSTVAGTTQTFTVEAEDTYGNEVSSFLKLVSLTSSDPQATILPTTNYFFTSPEETFSIDFKTAGSQSITATDFTPTVTSSSTPVTITAGTFAQFGFIGLQNTVAGITQTFTVEAQDAYGNEVSTFSGLVDFSSSDPNATGLSSTHFFSSPSGTLTIDFKTAGAQSITATDSPSVTSSSTPVTITAGTFAKFGFIGLQSTVAGITQTFTVEAEDAYGNELSSFSGSVSLSSSDPRATGLPSSSTLFSSPEATFSIAFKTAGSQSIRANETFPHVTSSSTPVSITASTFAQFGFIGLQNTVAGADQTLTVEAQDTYGNEVSSFSGTVDFSSSDPSLSGLPASYSFSGPSQTFSITFETAGTQTIHATDTITSSSTPVTITAGSFAQFGFIGLQSTTAGIDQTFTVKAEDAYGNEVSTFSGLVDFSSSDPNATGLSSSYAFGTPSEILSIDFRTTGTQTITAIDFSASPSISSSSTPVTITAGTFAKFGFIGLQNATAGTTQTFTVEAEDTYGNEVSSFNQYVQLSSSDPQATGLPSSSALFSGPSETFSIAFKTAGAQSISALDVNPGVSSASSPVTITAGLLSQFGFIGLTNAAAGTTQTFTVEAEDAYGNEILGYFNGVSLTSSDPHSTILPSSSTTFISAAATFSIAFETTGTQTLSAFSTTYPPSISGSSTPVTITAGPFAQFGFIGLQSTVAGTTQTFTVEAEDAYGNEVSSFIDGVHLSSSDSQATGLPSTYTPFTSPAETFSIAFKTAGMQSITAASAPSGPVVTTSSSPVTISAGSFAQFGFIGLQSTVAGTTQTFTVEAQDAYGNEVSSFSGTVDFSSSDPNAVGLPSSSSFSSPSETLTINFHTAGTQSITAIDSPSVTSSSSPVTISAGDFDHFGFIGLSNASAGTPQTLTIEAEDVYGNETTVYAPVDYSSSDPQLSGLPTSSFFAGTDEVFTITFKTAGTQSISANEVFGSTFSSTPVTITPSSFDQFGFVGLENGAAGTTQSFTVEAEDTYGNELLNFSGEVSFSSSDPNAVDLPSSYLFTSPAATLSIDFHSAGTQTITAADLVYVVTSSSSPVTITHGVMDQFAILGLENDPAGTPQTITVEAEDAYGNIDTNYLGTISFSSSDPQAGLPAFYTFEYDNDGVKIFDDGVTLKTAGPQTVTVTSLFGGPYIGTAEVTITPAAAQSFSLTPSGEPGLAETISITAYDAYGNVATGYDGTLDFSTSDPDATLPASDTMTAGEGDFVFTFGSTGTFSVSAFDSVDIDIQGSTLVTIFKQTTQSGSISSAQPQVFYGQNVTLTATFSATEVGDVPLSGLVAFYDGNTYLGTGTMVPSDPPATVTGQATLTVPMLTPGSYTVTAVYSGNGNYASATSEVPVTVSVTPATTSTTLSSNTTPQGTVLTASVVATSPGNPPLVGNVSFYNGATLLGVAPVVDGVASLNIGVVSGSNTFTATFSSDGTASTSGTTVTVSTDGPQIVGLSRLGFGIRPTVIVLTFNQPLNVASAQNPESYELFSSTGHRYALASVEYNPATLTVSIVPWQRLPIKGTFKLEVIGTGSNAVTNANGLALDGLGTGKPGSNFTTKFNWRALAAPDDSPAVVYQNGQAIVNYQGGFTADYNAVYAATQYYLQHAVDRGGPVPALAAKVGTAVHVSARPQIVFDNAPDAVKRKLVTTGMGLPKVSRHRHGRG